MEMLDGLPATMTPQKLLFERHDQFVQHDNLESYYTMKCTTTIKTIAHWLLCT